MKANLIRFGRYSVIALVALFMAVPVLSQLSLRKALDYDGDGRADFVIFRPSNNAWYSLRSGGSVAIDGWGLAAEDFMVPGDYDGDGRGDLAVWRDTNGLFFIINSSNGTVSIASWGISGDEPVARDYDGDGRTDYAVVRRTGGSMVWYILRSSDSQVQVASWGLSTDFTAPGDYDGDGKFDFCVQRPGPTPTSPAVFYVLTNGTFNVSVVSWGWGNDLVVPGDYDGDGKTDFAVVREGSTTNSPLIWYIIRSSDNVPIGVSFGDTGTDLNAQADYDGDGKTDIAIWRDTTGQFWYRSSINNAFNVVAWGSPNDYPVASYDTH
ncbi:MAG: VCBS repeat-containing protein [Acidobacteriota bacterium]|nr:MAG: VCBS repeat-containing protein [Acidobacteriota bacterium]